MGAKEKWDRNRRLGLGVQTFRSQQHPDGRHPRFRAAEDGSTPRNPEPEERYAPAGLPGLPPPATEDRQDHPRAWHRPRGAERPNVEQRYEGCLQKLVQSWLTLPWKHGFPAVKRLSGGMSVGSGHRIRSICLSARPQRTFSTEPQLAMTRRSCCLPLVSGHLEAPCQIRS